MTKQDITNNIATLEAEVAVAREKRHQIEQSKDTQVRELLTTYLTGYDVFQNGFTLTERSGGDYWTLGRVREEGGRETDELTINLVSGWNRAEMGYRDVQASFYSTSERSQFELERMVVIGKVGQMLLNKKETILEQVNTITDNHRAVISELNETIYGKEREISELKRQINEWESSERLSKAIQEGVEFKEEFVNRKLTIGRHEFWGTSKLKATPVGTGKFCKLELTNVNRGTYEYHTKVKTESLTEALTYYRDRIVS